MVNLQKVVKLNKAASCESDRHKEPTCLSNLPHRWRSGCTGQITTSISSANGGLSR